MEYRGTIKKYNYGRVLTVMEIFVLCCVVMLRKVLFFIKDR